MMEEAITIIQLGKLEMKMEKCSLGKRILVSLMAGCLSLAVSNLSADPKDGDGDHDEEYHEDGSLNSQWLKDIKSGRLSGDGSVVQSLILNRHIPIPYDYISTLMRTPNAFGRGPACIICHSSSNPSLSYRGLDLSTCEGMKTGVTEGAGYPIFTPGKSPKRSVIARRLRNNRMPLGTSFSAPANPEAIRNVRSWIANGARNDEYFEHNVLPLFSTPGTFVAGTPACTACHMSNQEPPSFHEMDLTSHDGIMLGADSVAKGLANATKIVIPGDPDNSPLLQHLREDRMPPGIPPTDDRDHPNTLILFSWIEQGAKCK